MAETDPHLVGGVFGLEVPQSTGAESRLHLDAEDALFLVNARSAIALVVDRVRPATVWLPSYLCQTLLDAVASAPKVEFYEVTHELRPGTSEWVDRVQGGDLVIVIDYFGFPFEAGWAEDARGRGAIIIRDAGQALLSTASSIPADFHVYSPRKFLGVPDGGILTAAIPFEGPQSQLEEAPVEWWLDGLAATVLRRSFDRHGGARDWFDLFRRYEAAAPVGNYRMSHVSRTLLDATDCADVAARRMRNYGILAELLGEIALFPRLPDGVVPLGFPVRIADRDRLRQALFDHDIYPAVHWPVPSSVPPRFSESRRLAADILTLPCDQRYSPKTMKRMAQLITSLLEQ